MQRLQGCQRPESVRQESTLGLDVIVIPTHISGAQFLDNLLRSFNGYNRYPILVVINACTSGAWVEIERICARFPNLPITIEGLQSNSFELGGLLVAMRSTSYQNFFLLPHSCEVVDPAIFEIAFVKYRDRSVAYFLQNYETTGRYWDSHIGKYRRSVLEAVQFEKYLPRNAYEAVTKSEFGFTVSYNAYEHDSAAIFENGLPPEHFVEKFGRLRLKIATQYLIKWKSHWALRMVIRDLAREDLLGFASATPQYGWLWVRKAGRWLSGRFFGLIRAVRAGWPWHPDYFRWRLAARQFPSAIGAVPSQGNALRYRHSAVDFFNDSGRELLLRHDLGPQSLVLEVGAYIGDWAWEIATRYHSHVIAFEPLPCYYGMMIRRFEQTGLVVDVRGYGLAEASGSSSMGMAQMGSSEFLKKTG